MTDNRLDSTLYGVLIHGYENARPLPGEERVYFPTVQRAGYIRFWMSHLLDFRFPRPGGMVFIRDPNVFKDLLLSLG